MLCCSASGWSRPRMPGEQRTGPSARRDRSRPLSATPAAPLKFVSFLPFFCHRHNSTFSLHLIVNQYWNLALKVVKGFDKIEAKEKLGDGLRTASEGLRQAALSLRGWAEGRYGGLWEAVVSFDDFGFAACELDSFYCKIRAADGKTATLWKVMDA